MSLPQHLARSLVDHWANWPPVDGWIFVNNYRRVGVNHRYQQGPDPALVAQIQRLRAQGMSYTEIARRFDMSESKVRRLARGVRSERSSPSVPRTPGPWTYGAVRSYLKEAAVAAGLDLPKGRATHVIRHHRVSGLGDLGFDSHQIGRWIGDTAQTIDLVYRHPMPSTLARMQNAMEDRLAPEPGHRPTDGQSEGGA